MFAYKFGSAGADTFFDNAPGGTHEIDLFTVGTDKFSLSDSTGTPTLTSLDFSDTTGNTTVVLSDTTTITFVNAHLTNSDFT